MRPQEDEMDTIEKRGRKRLPRDERRSERLWLGLTPPQAKMIRKAARLSKLAPEDWARDALLSIASLQTVAAVTATA